MKIILILSTLLSAGYCQLDCTWANSLDCTHYSTKSECGTDGVTYANRCYFAKAYCKDISLHIYADTDCASAGFTGTTVVPTGPTATRAPIFLGHDAVFDFFCRELSHQDCPNDTEQVCGSDQQTYPNVCEFQKQRCTHRELKAVSFGSC